MKNLYMGQTAVVRTEGVNSYRLHRKKERGVRQGCPLSPPLFNINIRHSLVDWALENIGNGVKIGSHLLIAVRFADDQVIVANVNVGLQRIIDTLDKTTAAYRIRINNRTNQSDKNQAK